MPGARGDPVQEHVVGAIRHAQEPKMDHLTVDKTAQDRQPPTHHVAQIFAQVSEISLYMVW